MSGPVPGSRSFFRILAEDEEDEGYELLEGVRVTSWKLLLDAVEVTSLADGGWRKLLPGAGLRSLQVRASGLYMASPLEQRLRQMALSGGAIGLELALDDALEVRGAFIAVEFELTSSVAEECGYELLLHSAGPISII